MRDHIHIRRFLNRRGFHAGAYVYAVVADSSTCRDADCDHHYCTELVLRFSDCDRVVSFDFDLDSADGRRNSLHKVDVMIDSLCKFRDAMALEADRAAARAKRSH